MDWGGGNSMLMIPFVILPLIHSYHLIFYHYFFIFNLFQQFLFGKSNWLKLAKSWNHKDYIQYDRPWKCSKSANIWADIGSLGHNEVSWAQKSSFLDDFWGQKSSQNEDFWAQNVCRVIMTISVARNHYYVMISVINGWPQRTRGRCSSISAWGARECPLLCRAYGPT